jgi:pyrroloquinoline-quinone synthase
MNIQTPLSREELFSEVTRIGALLYHHNHPFHTRMHQGSLSPDELRCWIKNRFYYQSMLPIKDAIVLSKLTQVHDRRLWVKRIIDQDGDSEFAGGIDAWILLGNGAGIKRNDLLDFNTVGTLVKSSVDSYIDFVREHCWLEAVASSLTELFAPKLIAYRLEVFQEHYGWIKPSALEYFFNRLKQAPRDSDHALELVLSTAKTCDQQELVLEALRFKCNLLWQMLDGIEEQCRSMASPT